ncbi:MAG: HAMP domain-containing protein, partial [Candidatus Poribacteria bacterium]|nr:HAMP domain-containing protein [Candidatus Poribacteria bacterium]
MRRLFGGWRIQSKIVVPFTAVFIVVMSLSAVTILLMFNRYSESSLERMMNDRWQAVNETGFLAGSDDFGTFTDFDKVKRAFGLDVIGSAANGDYLGGTLNRDEFSQEDRDALIAMLVEVQGDPKRQRTVALGGTTYRAVHHEIDFDRRAKFITLMAPINDFLDARRRIALAVVGVTLTGILLVAFIGNRIARTITLPIGDLVGVTRRIADGDLTRSVNVSTQDEIGQLGSAFNEMTEQLRRSQEELVQSERLATAG